MITFVYLTKTWPMTCTFLPFGRLRSYGNISG